MITELYLDANATSPVLPAAASAAMAAMQDCFGNPSSSHATGLRARALREHVRACARRVLGAPDGHLMFNSGATEGIQNAVLSALCAVRERRARAGAGGDNETSIALVGATEHKAVSESLAHWNRLLGTGLELRVLPVDGEGRHRLEVLRELAPRLAFVATMAANNETGVVSDLDGIAAVLHETASPALWMVDCVQALGKLPLNLGASRIDYAPFSGHKLYAPKGIGMLYVRAGAPFTPLMCGGGQEDGLRSGTENMSGIAALGAVLAALERGDTFRGIESLNACRARLVDALTRAFPGVVFNAPAAHALPTTINFSVPGVASAELLELFDAAGMRVSAGSACGASRAAPSHVLDAMGMPAWRSASAVRLSIGPLLDDATLDLACERIARCGAALALPAASEGVASTASDIAADTVANTVAAADAAAPFDGAPDADIELDAAALHGWLAAHPDAIVVDVRGPREHSVAGGAGQVRLHGRAALNVPLARVAEHAPAWLGDDARPLLFVCRSGARSARAARTLRALGHPRARSLAGGFALAG